MRIIALVENDTLRDDLKGEHGLSLYIETENHRLLFDMGASGLFLENAEQLGIDLSLVDMAIISHGHYDHGGGLPHFLEVNSKAKIYFNQYAFGNYYSQKKGRREYIGLKQKLIPNHRFIFAGDYLKINEELSLYSNIKGNKFPAKSNENLLIKQGRLFFQDPFIHEQNLLIRAGEKQVLIAGCAHRGIANIINHITEKSQRDIHYVFGGFHLYNPTTGKSEEEKGIRALGAYLKNTNIKFYTGHCTGKEPLYILESILHDGMHYLFTGSEIIL